MAKIFINQNKKGKNMYSEFGINKDIIELVIKQ